MNTNGTGLVRNADARSGAARPSTDTPRPLRRKSCSATSRSWAFVFDGGAEVVVDVDGAGTFAP